MKKTLKLIALLLGFSLEIYSTTVWIPTFLSLQIFGLADAEYTEAKIKLFYTLFSPYLIGNIITCLCLIFLVFLLFFKEKLIKHKKMIITIFIIGLISILISLIIPLILDIALKSSVFTNVKIYIFTNLPLIIVAIIYITLFNNIYAHNK